MSNKERASAFPVLGKVLCICGDYSTLFTFQNLAHFVSASLGHKNGLIAGSCLLSGPGTHSGDPEKPVRPLFVLTGLNVKAVVGVFVFFFLTVPFVAITVTEF